MSSLEQLFEGSYSLCAPAVDADNNLFMACATSGVLLKLTTAKSDNGATTNTLTPVMETNGSPSGLAFDPQGNDLYLADQMRQCIVKIEPANEAEGRSEPQMTQFIEQFEGKLLRGPSKLCFDRDGELIFTDSGAFGDTNLAHPVGCVYRTVQNRMQLVPLVGPALAYPSGIGYSITDGAVFVTEMMQNRVLRFVQRPQGVYHGSVFTQLAGSIGPSDVAVHPVSREVYVATYDFASCATNGTIRVFLPNGEERGAITLPGPEISGLCFDRAGKYLYITEQSHKRLYRIAV